MLGLAYELGVDVDTDIKRAEFYYKVSSYRGSYDGKYLYAAVRLKQSGAASSALLAEMIDAAEHKSIYAMTYLGDDYYYGRNGCDKDTVRAYSLWKQAAKAGGIIAMYYMAYGHHKGECVEKDFELAYMYALMATEYGFPRVYRLIAFMYEDGEYFEQDYDKAIEMYEEAIKRGDYLSLCYEGWIYGERKDFDKKRELYEKAANLAESGKIESGLPFYRMGYIYEYGEGVPKDIEKAAEYYLMAAGRKNNSALKYAVSTIMKVSDLNHREILLHRAYELGCEDAAYELGNIEKSKGNGKRLSEYAVKFYANGAEGGDMKCVIQLLYNYSFVFGNGNHGTDRLEAIRWFQFLFANADEEFLEFLRKNNFVLATYYYAYAMELDYDPDHNMPDREFVRMYFQKSLEESPVHLNKITDFVVEGYLFPEDSASGLRPDVFHAEEILELVENYLADYYDYLVRNESSECRQLWDDLKEKFKRGYDKIAEYHKSGKFFWRDSTASKRYKDKAAEIIQEMNNIAKRYTK